MQGKYAAEEVTFSLFMASHALRCLLLSLFDCFAERNNHLEKKIAKLRQITLAKLCS